MPPQEFWRLAHDIERLAQLKLDLHHTLGWLLTRCYELADADPACADYWQTQGRIWDQNYRDAMALINEILNLATYGKLPVTQQLDQRTIRIEHIQTTGDVIIANVTDSQNVAIGKELQQDVNVEHSRPDRHASDCK